MFIQLLCMAPMMKEVFPHATDWDVNKNTCEIVSCCLTKELAGKETQSGSVSVDRFVSWLSQAPVVETIYTTLFSFMFLHHGIGTVDLRQRLAFTIDPESGRKSYDSLLVPELMQIPFHPSNYRFSSDLLDMGAVMFLNSFLPGGTGMILVFYIHHAGVKITSTIFDLKVVRPLLILIGHHGLCSDIRFY